MLLVSKLDLFAISTITLLKLEILVVVVVDLQNWYRGIDFLISFTHQEKIGRHYANTNQSA
jgi:hypothetical protein